MKLILLRHEDRNEDKGFYSELTDKGKSNLKQLTKELSKYNIDIIFSSPFLRTIQTIYPFAKKNKQLINIELGLSEYLHNQYFLTDPKIYTVSDVQDPYLKSIINYQYQSIASIQDFVVLEDEDNLEKRVRKFLSYLIHNYPDKTILIVSHKAVLNKIKDLVYRATSLNDEFEMGHIEILNSRK